MHLQNFSQGRFLDQNLQHHDMLDSMTWAAPWPVIENIYVVLHAAAIEENITKKEGQEEGVDEILVCGK